MSSHKEKKKFKLDYKGCYVTIYSEDSVATYKLLNIWSDTLEYEEGVLPLVDARKFYDVHNGGLHYVYHLDLPARVEASKIKLLARSTAINNMFKFEKNKSLDIFKLLPYVIAVLAILV